MVGLLREAFNSPWKVWNEIWRLLAYPRVRLVFALNGITWGRAWRFYGVPIIQRHQESQIVIGSGLQLRSSLRSNPLGPNRPVMLTTWQAGAMLRIGDEFGMTGGTLCAAEGITIGQHVTVGANSTIIDTDFHPLQLDERRIDATIGKSRPIVIEDDVFIGMNCLILKGVVLGRGCVIGAGSVVIRDVPPGVLAAGNPARVIGQIDKAQTES